MTKGQMVAMLSQHTDAKYEENIYKPSGRKNKYCVGVFITFTEAGSAGWCVVTFDMGSEVTRIGDVRLRVYTILSGLSELLDQGHCVHRASLHLLFSLEMYYTYSKHLKVRMGCLSNN